MNTPIRRMMWLCDAFYIRYEFQGSSFYVHIKQYSADTKRYTTDRFCVKSFVELARLIDNSYVERED